MAIPFVQVNEFTPNLGQWTPIGNIASWQQNGNTFTLNLQGGRQLQISFPGSLCYRVRFNPQPGFNYTTEISPAVVSRSLGNVNLNVQNNGSFLVVDTGAMQVRIDLQPYRIRAFRGSQLISSDEPTYNLVYIPGQQVIANFKTYPANALYCGLGERAGASLFKNQTTTTFFNYDNFTYSTGRIPLGQGGGPLNPAEPLYCSVPLILEVNPNPQGDFAGAPYAYGIFFDNPSQSYVNIGASDYSNMFGKYYFGALFGDMDYYFMCGSDLTQVLPQYTTLTGTAPMPPKYVFGFHQGGYGYYDRYKLGRVANSYRAMQIPIDGLHIDVDFQDNYRTFTHSDLKFPDVVEMMQDLHTMGFKCSTNITPLLTQNALDEDATNTPYAQRQALSSAGALLFDTRDNGGPSPNLYVGSVGYGVNQGSNPYPAPGLPISSDGSIPLGASGNYTNYGNPAARAAWGQQYQHLIQTVGMDMVWQDMMCPAIAFDSTFQPKTFPLDLMVDRGDGVFVQHGEVHNIHALLLLEATWAGIEVLRPQVANLRNFIIARGGFAGMQRYAALWTGDSPSSWDYLSIYVAQILNIGLSGIPISGSDIGGFANGPLPQNTPAWGTDSPNYVAFGQVFGGITNYELLTRWTQAGAFLPWFRNHYNGYTKQFQEIYEYGEPVPTNCRPFIQLRYRMLQIFYDAMHEWTQSGTPICRPIFWHNTNDLQAYGYCNDEFLVGRDFLVAPVLTQHFTANPPTNPVRNVYLPAGSDWYAFKDNQYTLDAPVPGGTLIQNWFAPLNLVPMYVRAGAILPMRETEQWVGQLPQNPLTINIYPGPDSTYRLYQDDGISRDAVTQNRFRVTQISHAGIPNGQSIRVQRVQDNFTPACNFYFVGMPGTTHPSSVTLANANVPDVSTPQNLAAATQNAYYWNASIQVTFVKVFDTSPDVTLVVLFP